MQLLDVVLGQGDVLLRQEHHLHNLGVARYFLLVAGAELLDLQARQKQALDITSRKLAPVDASGRADTLDGGDAQERLQPLRHQRTQGAPSTLEFVNPGDQTENVGRDLAGGSLNHGAGWYAISTPICTHSRHHRLNKAWLGFQDVELKNQVRSLPRRQQPDD